MYKPPKNSSNFIHDLNDLLLVICIEYDQLIIVGYLNIHTDNPQDRRTKTLSDTLHNFGLTQHVNKPTHKQGHTLDLIISKGLKISNISVVDVALSDHFCIFLESMIPNQNKTIVKKRPLVDSSAEIFKQLYCSNSTDSLVEHFNGLSLTS